MNDRSPSSNNKDGGSLDDEFESLRKKYGVNKKYRKTAAFSKEDSYFDGGNGKYPPDWGHRRKAILEYQDHQCARCRTDLSDTKYNCHHYRPISEGGTHELQNLVVLCLSCHKLIHPAVDDLDGNWRDAPIFPARNADPRVATVRKPTTQAEQQKHLPKLELLQLTSAEGENIFATSEATYAISPTDAIGARDNLDETLKNVGLLPSQDISIRVINSEHSPLKGATVELALLIGGHGTYTMEGRTDKYGEANFTIPEVEQASVTVRKSGFETLDSNKIPIDTPPYEHTLTLEHTGAGAAIPTSTSDTTNSSRRNLLTLGATALGGVVLGGILFGSSSSPEENVQSSSDPDSESVSTQESIPALGEDWSFDTGTAAAIQSIRSTTEHSYISTKVGTVTALSSDGSEQWSADLRAESTEPLVILQDTVIATAKNQIRAINSNTGETIWEFSDIPSNQEPLVAADEQSVTFIDSESDPTVMVSIDPSTGDETWRTDIEGRGSRPTLTENAIFSPDEERLRVHDREGERTGTIEYATSAGSRESISHGHLTIENDRGYLTTGHMYSYDHGANIQIHAFNVDAETHLWTQDVSGSVEDLREFEPPTITEGSLLYGIGHDINTVDDSGVARWERSLDGSVTSMPVRENDTVYVGMSHSEGHLIQGLDDVDGKVQSETPLERSPVAYTIANSRLLIGTDRGELKTFETTS